ncbi:SDR family NAD(P)-dependent oxidoreductase [Paenibacillus sedimenti]|uniref:SDR family oxidoreductase n=1 Tax=Paenibacillus sedimenti TaxID=2770274 RepID=A0A926QJG3_9BACL|nr:SDR family NAD(P)-dependent oxidoreductase [Paenibacillus sedimenti]MBD0380469.1 SDR family oxidoreductase [Paenibacillus sedimenti]
MDLGLYGKVVLVTGGSKGIGKATVLRYGAEGASVVLTYANDSFASSEVVKEIRERGGLAEAVQMDLTRAASIHEAIAGISEKYGSISVLVNNAVTGERRPVRVEEGDPEDWYRMIDHNLKATYLVTKSVLPFMKGGQWGRIVHVSSEIAEDGMAGASSYMTAKAGLHGFSRALAVELASEGIFSNVVMPGLTLTERNLESFPPDMLEKFASSLPARRLGTPDDVAALIAFLGSAANSFVNGEMIRVTGGK